jgi:hypothetical protein
MLGELKEGTALRHIFCNSPGRESGPPPQFPFYYTVIPVTMEIFYIRWPYHKFKNDNR